MSRIALPPPVARALLGPAAALFVAFAVYVLAGAGAGVLDTLFNDWIYNLVLGLSGAACLARATLVRRERLAWALLGGAILLWLGGDIAFAIDSELPIPSFADALWLGFYPPAYVALMLLVRARVVRLHQSAWLDGLIAACAVAGVSAAIVFQAVLDGATASDAAEVATNLAYPLGDLLLLGIVAGAMTITGWRRDRTWTLIAAALATFAVTDSLYLHASASGTYAEGGPIDLGWPLAMLLLAFAAWHPARRQERAEAYDWRVLLVPSLYALVSLGLVVYDHFVSLNLLALALAAGGLLAVIVRMLLTFRENLRMLAASRVQATTDALTGLANRRNLIASLEQRFPSEEDAPLELLALFDLDGFKTYNDTFGHPAGDALLTRLAGRMQASVSGRGAAFRIGGDEFCALLARGEERPEELVASVARALAERGEGFEVTASYGWILLPEEASTAVGALGLADQRMYTRKRSRASTMRQTKEVLLRALIERTPAIGGHLEGVAEMAGAVAAELGLPAEEVERVRLAAELHDVGKMAIPDAILRKPGPLTPAEREFVRGHTVIGERILGGAPALAPVARLVGLSHEHWDGSGYPEGLAGEEIPLGARIVLVCDAFDGMISERPYREGRRTDEALAELRRCAGQQFDPGVVAAFEQALVRRAAQERADVRPAAGLSPSR